MTILQWFKFGLPSGQALYVVGFLDLMIATSRIFETYAVYFYEGVERQALTDFSHHLDYMEYIQLSLELVKFLLAFVLWIGGLLCGFKSVLKAWMYLSGSIEIVLQFLIWIVQYHLLLTDVEAIPIIKLTYCGLIRLLIRAYLITSVFSFLRTAANPTIGSSIHNRNSPSTNEASQSMQIVNQNELNTLHHEEIELLPIGLGFLKIFRFYYMEINRFASLLLTIDFSWGLCRLLENELTQGLFGQQIRSLPSSSWSTPIWSEERIIRIFRMILDLLFLQNIRKGEAPLQGGLIVPKLVEIFVSLGILIFLRVVEYDRFPLTVFTVYYILYIFDILFRIGTFAVCYKAYGDFLCQRHRMAVSSAKHRAQNSINK